MAAAQCVATLLSTDGLGPSDEKMCDDAFVVLECYLEVTSLLQGELSWFHLHSLSSFMVHCRHSRSSRLYELVHG